LRRRWRTFSATDWQPDTPLRAHIEPLGDFAVLLRFGEHIDENVLRRIRAAYVHLLNAMPAGAIEVVPAFTTIAIHYDPSQKRYAEMAGDLETLAAHIDEAALPAPRTVTIPVLYGGAAGPDLEHVGRHAGMTTDEVIRIHAAGEYLVHMIGFAPGFPYLGGLDERIACPRRDSPRTQVPAGSVAIGGTQTGIYPIESPGGWQIIGRTELMLFDPTREPAAVLQPGDRVRFAIVE
jgi:inhibitor of KinA